MINIGQAPNAAIEPVRFEHPRHPGLGLEVLSLAELHRRLPAHHRRQRSRPAFHQLMWVEAGAAEHVIDFEHHRAAAGTALHLRPGQVQQFVRDRGARGWVVLFRPDFLLPEPELQAWLGPAGPGRVSVARARRPVVAQAVRALVAACDALPPGKPDPAALRALQHQLIALLLQLAQPQDSRRSDVPDAPTAALRLHRRFMAELERDFVRTRAVAGYASRLGCSVKTLSRACAAAAGASPKRVIEARVTLEAKRLLAHTNLTVLAIGFELGFSEPTNFVKHFRRHVGITPAAFRVQWQASPHPG